MVPHFLERGCRRVGWETYRMTLYYSEGGIRMMNRTPTAGEGSICIEPRISRTLSRTASIPTPRPEMALTLCGSGEPGEEDEFEAINGRES